MIKYKQKIAKLFLLTILIYLISSFIPVTFGSLETVSASSIQEKDIYKGLGLVLFLMIVSNNDEDEPEKFQSEIPININLDKSEIDILAKAIHAEARGESYQGKVAVGAVIVNRMISPDFPNSIREIVYQKGQFTSVENGQINLTPNSESYRAAYDAASGKDPSKGSLYFYNPVKSRNPSFFDRLTKIVQIGNHVFLK